MGKFLNEVIDGIDTQSIVPHSRNGYARDETIFSPDGRRFVIGYNIYEHSMGNEMSRFAWGEIKNAIPVVTNYFTDVFVYCWGRPFACWVSPDVFIVKINAGYQSYPLAAVDVHRGALIIENTDSLDTRPKDIEVGNFQAENWLCLKDFQADISARNVR